MGRRLSLFVLLASALTFLASLFLRWVQYGPSYGGRGVLSLLNLSFGGVVYDGWGAHGEVAALVALALAAGAGASLLRPQLERRLPLASAGVALLYLALFNATQLDGLGVFEGGFRRVPVKLGPGAYLGIACAAVALVAAVGARWDELAHRPSVPAVVAFALTIGLLTAYILPWLQLQAPRVGPGASGYFLPEIESIPATFIALLACFALPLWGPRTPPDRRPAAAVGLAVLVWGTLSYRGVPVHWPYEAWLQLGCSLGLVALALATSRGLRFSLLPLADIAGASAASLLVVSLFLPWQRVCGPGGGACGSYNGWTVTGSATAGGLAVVLVLLLGFRHLFVELAVGAAIYVLGAGFTIIQYPLAHLGYGAPLGFAGAALLLVAAGRRLGIIPSSPKRLLTRFAPLLACLVFLALPVALFTGRASFGIVTLDGYSPWGRWFWLELAAILIALRLLGRWLGGPKADDELVVLSLALLVVTVLDVILVRRAFGTINWEGWVSLGLCLLLAALGWLERNGGLENFRIPEEIWRVDRLPVED